MPLIETSFEVPADTETVWAHLLDVEKIVPCMPGAELTEIIDESHWKGKMKLKLGPVTLNFAGKVAMEERDEAAHRVVLETSAMEQRGKGAASATVTSRMEPFEGGTRVHVSQDIKVSGQAAQFSRGMMTDVATRIVHQFADCLKAQFEAGAAEPTAEGATGAPEPAAGGEAEPAAGGEAEPDEGPGGAQPTSDTAVRAPASSAPGRPAPSLAAPAELNATRLVVAAGGRAAVRLVARAFEGLARAFEWVAKSLGRIGGA